MKKILFICLGNICRSPAAAGIAKKMYPSFEIESAATGSWHAGEKADKRSIAVCAKHNIDIFNHRARKIRVIDEDYFDEIICMDKQNILDLKQLISGKNWPKVSMLDSIPVADPYSGGTHGFEDMYEHLEKAIGKKIS